MALDVRHRDVARQRMPGLAAPEHIPELQRLLKALCSDAPGEVLFATCGDVRLREALIAHVNRFLVARKSQSVQLTLVPDDTQAPEAALADLASDHSAVHLILPDHSGDGDPWRGLDIAVAAIGEHTPLRLVLWLHPEQAHRLPHLMPQLWESRSGMFAFEHTPSQPTPAPARVPIRVGSHCLAAQSRRMVELQDALAQDPSPPRALRLSLLEELGRHYQALGEWENALRLVRDQELPIRRRSGDARAVATTLRRLADLHIARGALAEASALLRNQCIPAAEQTGSERELAALQGTLADVLEARGEHDAALHIRAEKELPLHERLGDERAAAITQGKIADLYQAHGQLDTALSVRRNVELPVFKRVGDARAVAITQGKIADALQARGELDAALRIRREETLPVYRRLGDRYSAAITQGKIADVLQTRGELNAALGTYQEVRTAFEQLGDIKHVARTSGAIADVLLARGEIEAALDRLRTDELPVYERIGDESSLLVCRAKIALALLRRNAGDDRTEANRLLCRSLADARRLDAPEAGRIAEILREHGMDCAAAPHANADQ